MSGALAKLLCVIGSLVMTPVVLVHAYGLSIQSWSWLVWGTIFQLLLLAAGGAWSKK